MSLQVWLPLTKDLRQQGLSDVSATEIGSPSWVNGKLGQAMRFGDGNASTNGLEINSNLVDLMQEEYSVSVWVCPYGNHYHYNGTIFSSGNWNNTCYAFGLKQDNSQVDILCKGYNIYITCAVPTNTWTHLVCTCDSSNMVTLYKNGELIGTSTRSNKPESDNTSIACIGRETYASGYFTFNGAINDFRLYDHCLSQMEVKELAKGLVLHYPLNRQGWGQENLITQIMIDADPWKSAISGNYTVDGKTGWILSNNQLYSKSGNGANNIFSGLTYEANTQYTISFKWRDDYRTDGKSSSLYIRFKYSDGTYSQVISSKDYNYWKEEIMTSTAGKTVSAITTTYGNGGNLLFTDLKLEKGAIKTPTSPIVNSDLYNSMGLNSTTEYDCSGFCNNGTKMTNTITYTSDTAKYAVSTHFNGTYDGIIIENFNLKDIINSAVTYAFWIKPESESGARSVYFGSYNTGPSWSIEKTTGNIMRLYWNGSPDESCSGATISDGVWQHICITKNGTNDVKVYINGVQKWTSTATHNNLNFPTTYRIGRDTRSNDGTPYKGLMSDFRIYATALSPSDVKSLYQNCATIDPDGTIRGQIRS